MPVQIMHVEFPADDTEAARAFWGSLFGWELQAFPPGSEYHMGQIGEQQSVAITGMEPGKRGSRPYFDVDDIQAGVARVRELGGSSGEPMPVPAMGWFATCTDPHGNDFGVWQTDPAAPSPAM